MTPDQKNINRRIVDFLGYRGIAELDTAESLTKGKLVIIDGAKFVDELKERGVFVKLIHKDAFSLNECHFHDSYEWIHFVWEKFRDLQVPEKHQKNHSTRRINISHAMCFKTKEETAREIYDAIDWYNSLV